ncbi:carboxylesterase [Halosimplex carlsbadense 2-9-1]|uniref:Carboxylesterase n=1 Tax=Halosimplex carlsbadense 2-9-1 TaxID=797114 RepID=M0CRE4_9EURY|nr:alpha/beta hydrolase [Halosimplex carlsbadense]ELZ24957.1 carboxylesterase [Halosimplex carlsbadense 2-9-1]
MESVRHDGRETAYRLAGVGRGASDATALYVHGSGATHRLWAAQYGPDGPAQPAAALDLSGHGQSDDVETDPGPETLDAYARDVIAVAEETGANALVGNSLGGAVVLHVALDTAFAPDALVLAGTGGKLTVNESLREWLADDFDRAVDVLHGPDRLFHDADERVLDRSRSQMLTTGQAVTHRDFMTCHAFDVRDRLDEIDAPALAVVGEHDSLTPPSYHEFLADRLPDCEYVEIPDAAHLAMAERPDAFGRAVGRFLDSVGD